MKLKKLKLQNIRSYKDAEINFPEGSVLLSGDIGSGKTSILLAIEFALFGLQPGQRGASLLRNGEKQGSIILEFEIDNKQVIIERRLKRKKTITQDYSAITIDDDKKELSITELKNLVLTLLSYPLEFAKKTNLLYRFTVYTPQEEMKQIILENPETRLTTLRHVFGIDKYKRIKENNSVLTAKLREMLRTKEGQILDLESKKENLKQKKELIKNLEKQILDKTTELGVSKMEREKIEQELNNIKEKINQKRNFENEIEKTKLLMVTKRDGIINFENEIKEIKENFEKQAAKFDQKELDHLIKIFEEKIEQINKFNNQTIDLSSQIGSLDSKKTELQELSQKIGGLKICPTCLQDVQESYKANIINQAENDLKDIESKLKAKILEKQKNNQELEKLKSEISDLEASKKELETLKIQIEHLKQRHEKIVNIEKQKQILDKDLELLTKQIDTLKESIRELTKFDNIFTIKEKELNEKRLIEKQIEIQKAEFIREKELTNNEILNLDKEIKEKEQIKQQLLYVSELETWLSNKFIDLISFIEKNVMIKLKEEFSQLFNKWFSVLVSDNFTVRLDDDFTPIIEQQEYELDYNYLSGGERTAVALAYRLALNQTINSLLSQIKTRDVVILDEPTDGFSEQQLDKIRDILEELNVEQLVLVSHEQKIESFVDKIIKFKKEQGITKIED